MSDETARTETQGVLDTLRRGQRIVTLDVVFRGLLGFVFVGMIVAASGMPQTSFGDPAAYPMFVGVIGLALWVASNIQDALGKIRGREQGRIYDIKFETGGMTPTMVWLRTGWVFGIMGATIGGVWLANFHVAIPVFLVSYLRFVGKLDLRWALFVAFLVEIPIVVLYGAIIHTIWPVSLLERVFDFSIQAFFDGPLSRFL